MTRSTPGRRTVAAALTIGALLALAGGTRAEPAPSTSGASRTGRPTAPGGEATNATAGEADVGSPATTAPVALTDAELPAETRTEPPGSPPALAPTPSAVPSAAAKTAATPVAAPPAPTDPLATAHVEVEVARSGCWLELRPTLGGEGWSRACALPCSTTLVVEGREARVTGAGVTPSNPFFIEPGRGTARLEARPGSAHARRYGIVALATGIPLVLAGFTGHAFGQLEESPTLRDGGVAVAALGAAAVAAALPLLAAGATRVRDDRGRRVATAPAQLSGL